MLKEFLIGFTERYHHLGHQHLLWTEVHSVEEVNRMMDSARGLGHRIVEGHDAHGLIDAIDIGGVPGAVSWFDHMLKDFTSLHGVPLPGAEVVMELTGMQPDEAVDWLCVNAADVAEVAGEAAALKLLQQRIAANPQLGNVALVVGAALGIVDDNPLLLAYNSVLTARALQRRYRLLSDEQVLALQRFCRASFRWVEAASVGSFMALSAWHILEALGVVADQAEVTAGVVDVADAKHLVDASDVVDGLSDGPDVVDGLSDGLDVVEGLSTLGVTILFSRAVKWFFDSWNGALREEVDALKQAVERRRTLRAALRDGTSPAVIAEVLASLPPGTPGAWRLA